jgi:hypothetical protein
MAIRRKEKIEKKGKGKKRKRKKEEGRKIGEKKE